MLRWTRSRTRPEPTPSAAPTKTDPALDRLVDEGMLIARSALRMAAKNHIIIDAIRSEAGFDEAALLALLESDAISLAQEKDAEAERLGGIAGKAAKRAGRATYHDDYRRQDVRSLTLRERVNAEMARRLHALAGDHDSLRSLLEAARESALEDMLHARLTAAAPFSRDADYLIERQDRLGGLAQDLNILYRRQKARLGDRIA